MRTSQVRSLGPREPRVKYPFSLLHKSQRVFLHSLAKRRCNCVADAFAALGVAVSVGRQPLREWMDEEAFHAGITVALRARPAELRDPIRLALMRFYLSIPLHEACDVPRTA